MRHFVFLFLVSHAVFASEKPISARACRLYLPLLIGATVTLGAATKARPIYRRLRNLVRPPPTPVPNQVNLGIEFAQMNGDPAVPYRLSDHPDAVFVFESYYLSCGFCNTNAKLVNELAKSFAEEPRVQVLDVGIDAEDSQYAAWINRHRPNHPVLRDDENKLGSQLGTMIYPSTYVIDAKGNVLFATQNVWSPKVETEIRNTVEASLKKKGGTTASSRP